MKLSILLLVLLSVSLQARNLPNVIIIFSDDHGYTDLGIHGIDDQVSTPHMDALAKGGGFIMVGEKGCIYHGGMRPNSPMLYPKARWEQYRAEKDKQVPKTIPRVPGIHRDWVESVKAGKKSCSDFSYSGPLTEAILLGALAIRTGKGLEWDAKNLAIKGNDAAAALIKTEARKGWRPEDLV